MRFRLVVIAAVLALVASHTAAQSPSLKTAGVGSDEPASLTSMKAVTRNLPNGTEFTFEGNVKLKQGTVTLNCDKLVALYDEKLAKPLNPNGKNPRDAHTMEAIRSMIASGNVKIEQSDRVATAGKAVLDNIKRTITLTEGPPRLKGGPNSGVADTIIFYIDENRFELRGGNGSPIRFEFNPGKIKKDNQ